MDIPRWKKWLSYFIEIPIEKVSSDLNPYLNVSLREGKFQLTTEKAIYSYDEAYDNFRHSFEKIHLPSDHVDILILGLGLGSIPIILEKIFKKEYRFIGVDIDAAIIELFSKYTLPRLKSAVEVVTTDAFHFMMQNTRKYPLICMDVFRSDVIPEAFTSIEFLTALKDALTPDGVLLFNCLALTKEDIKITREFFKGPFIKVFPSAGYFKVLGNWVLLNDSSKGIEVEIST